VVLIAQDHVGYVCDCASVVCGAVDIVDQDWISEGACGDIIELRPLNVDAAARGAAINEGLCASLDCGVRRLDLYIHCEGHRFRTRCNDIFNR
jgi:hypothetical protein